MASKTGHGHKTREKQDGAIAALLSAATLAEAAQQAGVGVRTLVRWLAEDIAFQAAYRDARRAVVQQAITQVQRATRTAVQTLVAVMEDATAPPSARVAASRVVLETAVKTVELEEIETRLARLEAQASAGAQR